MVLLVSKLKAQAGLEPGAQYWWGYSPSSTGEGGLFLALLARMPASTPLTDAHGRFTVSAGDVRCLHWELDSLTGSSAGGSLLQFG